MKTRTKILIVEDEMIIGANISLQLTELGYEITALVPSGEEALKLVEQSKPDLVLLDIQLKGSLNGIETASIFKKEYQIPIIFLTANSDDSHFELAKKTQPEAFISKPFRKLDLKRALELAEAKLNNNQYYNSSNVDSSEPISYSTDSIFVRKNEKLHKIPLCDIRYIAAERNYCRIYTEKEEHLIVGTLKDMSLKLPSSKFIRIHRSYLINLDHITEVGTNYVNLNRKALPITKNGRAELLRRFPTF